MTIVREVKKELKNELYNYDTTVLMKHNLTRQITNKIMIVTDTSKNELK